jgi:hypothetical protein
MAPTDRIVPICEILLGAAYADGRLDQREQETVRELLADLTGGALPAEVEKRIKSFDPKRFNVKAAATPFKGDPVDDKKRLLYLVAVTLVVEEEVLRASLTNIRKGPPPPPPGKKDGSVDVDMD